MSPAYAGYVQMLNTLKQALAKAQGTQAAAPIVAPAPAGTGTLGNVRDYIQTNTPVPTPTPSVTPRNVSNTGTVIADPMLNIATSTMNWLGSRRTPAYTPVPDIGGNPSGYGSLRDQMGLGATPAGQVPSGAAQTVLPAGTGAGQAGVVTTTPPPPATTTTTVSGGPTTAAPPKPPGADGSFQWNYDTGAWVWTPVPQTLANGSYGYYTLDSNGQFSWTELSTTANGSTGSGRTAAQDAADAAQAAYYNALAAGVSTDDANAAAQLAFEREKAKAEQEAAAAELAQQKLQWEQQLAWYQQQQAAQLAQEQKEAEDARRKWLAELAANPRDWIKYNLATTDNAGGVPSWLSKLFEGKVQAGASLDTAKSQNYFPALSKTWYNWMTPSERSMMEGYLSYAGTEPSDYWGNVWWMRGLKPQGAPKIAAFQQK